MSSPVKSRGVSVTQYFQRKGCELAKARRVGWGGRGGCVQMRATYAWLTSFSLKEKRNNFYFGLKLRNLKCRQYSWYNKKVQECRCTPKWTEYGWMWRPGSDVCYSVSLWLMVSQLDWCDPGQWWYPLKTLVTLWRVKIRPLSATQNFKPLSQMHFLFFGV